MKKSDPIYFAIVQIRFNEINYEHIVGDLKETFRSHGYPDIQESNQKQIDITIQNGLPLPTERDTKVLSATNIDADEGFIFNNKSLTIQTVNYSSFEDLSQKLLKIFSNLPKNISLIERLGYRTLNAFIHRDENTLDSQISNSVLGLYTSSGIEFQHNYNENLCINSDQVHVLSRIIVQNSEVGFPPDINGTSLNKPDVMNGFKNLHAMVDIDASWTGRSENNELFLKEQFKKLHTGLKSKLNNIVEEKL
ncbi:TIGR04255 family protein [Acinetobacter sp.]|uniref:TIGR04255 family protein n=1 Tax=Acinetobacter sp. TaxID=472 RepID=UPI0035B05DE4